MNNDPSKYRMQRIERLLDELQYEITRGMMEGELESETLQYHFYVPASKTLPEGVVWCRFETRPMLRYTVPYYYTRDGAKLTVVK
jgi:hypothetical protein